MTEPLEDENHVLRVQIQQQFMEALAESEGRYRRLVDSVSDIIFELDAGRRFKFLNRAWTTHTGLEIQAALGEEPSRFVVADDLEALSMALAASGSESERGCEVRVVGATGRAIWFELTTNPLRHGCDVTWFGKLTNIDARKAAEAERTRQAVLLAAISRAQSSYIGSEAFVPLLQSLIDEVSGLLGSTTAHVEGLLAGPAFEFPMPTPLQGAKDWIATIAGRFDVTDDEAWTEAHFLDDATCDQLELGVAPAALSGGVVLPLGGAEDRLGILVLGPPELEARAAIDLLRPVASTLAQLLRAERQRREHEIDRQMLSQLSRVASQTSNGVVITDLHGRTEWVNEGFTAMTGYSLEEVVGRTPGSVLQGPGSEARVVAAMREAVAERQGFDVDLVNYRRSGEPFHVRVLCNPMTNERGEFIGFIALQTDITRDKEWGARLVASEREKVTLLQEIHHRVKNNLQIVSSLLMLQSEQMPSEQARQLVEESVMRVRSMALVHQQLYESESLAAIDMGEYARRLGETLRVGLAPSSRLRVDALPVTVMVNVAVPLGLMLNELVTNAIKYGRRPAGDGGAPRRTGDYDVVVEIDGAGGSLRLSVIDAGQGMAEGFSLERSETLGLRLLRTLTRQLRGELTYDHVRGSRFTITCPLAT